ncbi:MAG TPA: FAD-binding oxidoreductase [Candidatus Dormibacteraeota bacterium]
MSGDPFWPRPAPLPAARPPRRSDVVVVGAGITGVAILRELQRTGIGAVALERDHLAAGATGRNAGFLLTGTAAHYAAAVQAHGRAVAGEVWDFTAANHDLLLEALGPRAARSAGHRRAGAWTLAAGAAEALELGEAAEWLGEDGLPGTFVAAPRGAPTGCRGGLLTPRDGEIDPVTATAALARACLTTQPGSLIEGQAVRGLEPGAQGVLVHFDHGEIHAGAVVLATNAWIAELAPQLGIQPVRAQMLATAPPQARRDPRGRPAYSHRGHRYWRRLAGGALLLGGCREAAPEEEQSADPVPTARIQAALDRFLEADLGIEATVTHRWAGIMGFSPDGLPLVGAVPGAPGVLVCGGYTGHGMGFAVHAARILVRHLGAGAPIPGWLDPSRDGRLGLTPR